MGKPNIDQALKDNNAAIKAVSHAVDKAAKALDNDNAKAVKYINANTKGILQTLQANSDSYSKFSEDFSLAALDGVIDKTINTAVNAIKLSAGNSSPQLAAQSAQDVGSLVKAVLGLAASSSSTDQNLQVTFSYIIAGVNNFAIYYAVNSTTVAAQNAWGSKDITVIASTYHIAMVNPDPAITRAQLLQKDLNTLNKLNAKCDDAMVAATSPAQAKAIAFRQNLITMLQAKITKEKAEERIKELGARGI